MQRIAVIGLGRFGSALARKLAAGRVEVLAIDHHPGLVDEIKDDVTLAVALDSTDEDALRSQDVQHVDVCVVAIGENFEASLLTAATIKRLGVPRLICRAQTDIHAEIFRRLGADEVIQPEVETGMNLARRLVNPRLNELWELSDGYTMAEVEAPAKFQGKTLAQIGLRKNYDVSVVFVRRPQPPDRKGNPRFLSVVPGPTFALEAGDMLLVIGSEESVARLPV